ncbi:hypothetical protein ACHAPU_006229 [Fusarium lateritium]
MLPIHENLVSAETTVSVEERKPAKLSYQSAIDKISNALSSLRIQSPKSKNLNKIIDDLRLQVDRLSIDTSPNTASIKKEELPQTQTEECVKIEELRLKNREMADLLDSTNKKVNELEVLVASKDREYDTMSEVHSNTIQNLEAAVRDRDSTVTTMQTEINTLSLRLYAETNKKTKTTMTRPFSKRLKLLSDYVEGIPFELHSTKDELKYIDLLYHIFRDEEKRGNAESFLRMVVDGRWFCLEEICCQGVKARYYRV